MTLKNILKMVQKWKVEALKIGCDKRNDSKIYKGHFVVYAADNIRFVMPLRYLNNIVFLELLRISEDKFGLSGNGPIVLPFDSILVKYLVNVFERGFSNEFEKVLLASVIADECSCSR
ncbi:hypothetical protein QVD17_03642 [Tagetes erecta]|uniref:Small auxin up regulated protein n=1 Tax=Tagetes erecta TaxID=13708 RepID=A0AAD8LAC3_TARER|nr:hypothetical protein QVD17_03642 [Tagetes erecta]